jgi:hypothetical protein
MVRREMPPVWFSGNRRDYNGGSLLCSSPGRLQDNWAGLLLRGLLGSNQERFEETVDLVLGSCQLSENMSRQHPGELGERL